MVQYRRDKTPGGTYFFTLALQDRTSALLTEHIGLLGAAFKRARRNNPFITKAMVVLPEHLHVVWQLPDDDLDYSKRWRQVKTFFTRALIKQGVVLEKNARTEYNLWQKRFWEHRIRDDVDLEQHVNYIHYNPVKHGLVRMPCEWKFSTIHRYIKHGLLPKDWGASEIPVIASANRATLFDKSVHKFTLK